MKKTVCIPRERYEYLVECERLVDLEFEERFSETFIKEVKESEKDYKKGRFKRFKTIKEAKRYLDTL
ncbi:MAG: hypothetical protein SCARUB_04591 [Candidatus Scalindua rubra]|uniref:Uncharacterized protein n=1 Tax=Candidatus Scalindua rubra TaxID=1872076 RepID=A0A1E3X3U4_9BACT|nr:MAG: hypothetical protein SCARUB_04591 [Candidatus Scalindua rubra]